MSDVVVYVMLFVLAMGVIFAQGVYMIDDSIKEMKANEERILNDAQERGAYRGR